jgi:hypothetical protein
LTRAVLSRLSPHQACCRKTMEARPIFSMLRVNLNVSSSLAGA